MMTNAQYILSRLSDRDLAELFTSGKMFYEEKFNLAVQSAFDKWRESTPHANKNFIKKTDKKHFDFPSVFAWSYVNDYRNNDKGERARGYRTNSLSFQVFLFEQYNKKFWELNCEEV